MKIRIEIDDLASSNIISIAYVSTSDNNSMIEFSKVLGELVVTFSNNYRYIYVNVSLGDLSKCMSSDSFGSAFSRIIKPNYIGTRLTRPWEYE